MIDFAEFGRNVGLYFIPMLLALCVHEYSHGWMARQKGDRTAEIMGRLTLNPFAHADPIGTFLLPLMALAFHFPSFGWAKPVPVNERNLRDPKNDMFWVALAGPASNLIMAFISVFVIVFVGSREALASEYTPAILKISQSFVLINLYLCVFNLIPVHPLDGGKILGRFLPASWNHWLEMNQNHLNIAMLVVFIMGGFKYLFYPVTVIAYFMMGFAERMLQ